MAFFERIKKIYNEADKALGGILPGGDMQRAPVTERDTVSDSRVEQPTEVDTSKQTTTRDVLESVNTSRGSTNRNRSSSNNDRNVRVNDTDVDLSNVTFAGQEEPLPLTDSVNGNRAPGINTQIRPTTNESVSAPPIVMDPIEKSYITRTGNYEYDFSTPEGLNERIQNIGDVLSVSLNPFSQNRVQANINNPSLRWAVEAVANNPYETAALATAAKAAYTAANQVIQGLSATGTAALSGNVLAGNVAKTATGGVTQTIGRATLNPKTARTAVAATWPVVQQVFKKNSNWIMGLIIAEGWTLGGASNLRGDAMRAFQFAQDDAIAIGDYQTARELKGYMDDLTNRTKWEAIEDALPLWGLFTTGQDFIESQKIVSEISDEALNKLEAQNEADAIIENKIQNGTATEADLRAYAEANPFSPIAQALQDRDSGEDYIDPNTGEFVDGAKDQLETEISDNRLMAGEELARRILDNNMSAEEIINDPDIRAFALDSNNQFSSITKLYNEAIAATGRGNFYGDGSGGASVPPSTLGFGLLNTGGATKNVDEEEQDDAETSTKESQSLNSLSLEVFGVNFSELSDVQKEILRGQN